MELHLIERPPDAFQRALTAEQLSAVCRRAFGDGCQISAVHELGGGSINTVFRITPDMGAPVILRVAPAADDPQGLRHERELLRCEYRIQPFLAPIAHLLPTVLVADWTHQIVARDYMLQAHISGESWQDVMRDLSAAELTALWTQLGSIARRIHDVQGTRWGPPLPEPPFDRWSAALLADFDSLLLDMAQRSLATEPIAAVRSFIDRRRDLFDAIGPARLLHGDLWPHNVLIRRAETGPTIVGVLDAGFAHWGDPAADWTIMRLTMGLLPHAEQFWEAYGPLPHGPDADLRMAVYQARSLGISLLELQRMGRDNTADLWSRLAAIRSTLEAA